MHDISYLNGPICLPFKFPNMHTSKTLNLTAMQMILKLLVDGNACI